MLVSCGIKNDLHSAGSKKSAHGRTIRYVRHAILYAVAILEAVELQLEIEQRRLRLVETDQLRWRIIEDLATQFRTDRARSPGYHYHLACKVPAHRLQIESYRVAPQQVLDINIPQLINGHTSFGQVTQARNGFEFPSAGLAPLNDPAHSQTGHRRHGNKNFCHRICGCHGGQLVNRPNHLDAVQANSLLRSIVVNAAYNLVIRVRQLTYQKFRG